MHRLKDFFLFRELAPHWAVVVLMAILIPALTAKTEKPGEFYPFSNYPMYDSFEPATYYVKVTDTQDQQVAIGTTFGIASSDVKKAFDRKLIAAKAASGGKIKKADLPPEIQQKAAIDVLQWLRTISPPDQKARVDALHGLRLHRVDITLENGDLKRQSKPVGEIQY
ncbi:MAG: hypothetical protein JNJ83_19640 [Verrucomicrobiaceae bacterium]|nr:hypothetical protein [Verrucomicrobiaceae bacterium]